MTPRRGVITIAAMRLSAIATLVIVLSAAQGRAAPTSGPTTAPATRPATQPIVQSDDGGPVVLHAAEALTHGKTIRYEPSPHKNTIGYWTHKEDWVSWTFTLSRPGKYRVEILQGCGKGSGGAEVRFTVGDQALTCTVQDTGGFQNFVPRDIGTVALTAGPHTLTVVPLTKPGVAVMDLRSVTLKPVD